jgi:hypothetical protein
MKTSLVLNSNYEINKKTKAKIQCVHDEDAKKTLLQKHDKNITI